MIFYTANYKKFETTRAWKPETIGSRDVSHPSVLPELVRLTYDQVNPHITRPMAFNNCDSLIFCQYHQSDTNRV